MMLVLVCAFEAEASCQGELSRLEVCNLLDPAVLGAEGGSER
jgi:hypothetical protein